jgi:hypothetical protein
MGFPRLSSAGRKTLTHVLQRAKEDMAVLPVFINNLKAVSASSIQTNMGKPATFPKLSGVTGLKRMLLEATQHTKHTSGEQILSGIERKKLFSLEPPKGIYGQTLDRLAGLTQDEVQQLSRRRIKTTDKGAVLSAYIVPNAGDTLHQGITAKLNAVAEPYQAKVQVKKMGCCGHGCAGCLS